tara:strand:+ start:807 stop:1094 length:288 start_codon:yes stop_codon:yes gene_type:complete
MISSYPSLRKIIVEQMASMSPDTLTLLKTLVQDNPFPNLGNDLEDAGFQANLVTEPVEMYHVVDPAGVRWGIIRDAKNAEDPDALVGNIAIGVME